MAVAQFDHERFRADQDAVRFVACADPLVADLSIGTTLAENLGTSGIDSGAKHE